MLGFDSAAPATPALWDAVAGLLRAPLVRLVYLDLFAGGTPEVALAHSRGGAVIGCANGATAEEVRGPDGHTRGLAAAAKWRELGAPAGTGIALDIEASWSPSPEYVAGWTNAVVASGYRPLVYGSLRAPGTLGGLAEAARRYSAVRYNLQLVSATPTLAWTGAVPPWGPDHGPLPVVGWQWAENVPTAAGAVDLDMWAADAPLWHAGPDVAAAREAISRAEAALAAARAALGG